MTLYTIYDTDGCFWCEYHENEPANSTETLYTDNFVKPRYNAATDSFFEAATQTEIDAYNQAQVPQVASKMRFFLELFKIGITRQMVYAAINGIPDTDLREVVLIKFELSQEFDRQDEHLNMLAAQFDISQTELDNLFIQCYS
jgi:hypothetical protein